MILNVAVSRFPTRFPEDESCRVPIIIRYPEKLKPRRSELLVGTLDLIPIS